MKPYFQNGNVKIYNGDCRELLTEILDEVDQFISDPPYGIGFKHYLSHDDKVSEYSELMRVFVDKPSAVLNYPEELIRHIVPILGPPNEVLTWVYSSNVPRQSRLWGLWGIVPDYSAYQQPCKNPGAKPSIQPMVQSYDWIECPQVKNVSKGTKSHPCQLPNKVAQWIVALCGNGTICDPFAGTGTILNAAIQQGFDAIGIEKEERYCEIAADSLSQLDMFANEEKHYCEINDDLSQLDLF